MAKDTEVSMSDDEIDALMAELDAQTGATAAAAPAPAAKPAAKPVEPVVTAEAEAEAAAELEVEAAPAVKPAPDLPRNPDPVKAEQSNFILPKHLRGDQPPEGRTDAPEETGQFGTAAPVRVEPAATALAAAKAQLSPAPAQPVEAKKAEPMVKQRPPGGLDHFIDVSKVATDTEVSETNLDNCMMQQASLRAYYGSMAARAEAQAARAKLLLGVKEAECYEKHRTALLTAGEKATEAMVGAKVARDPVYIAAKTRVIEAEQIAAECKAASEALKDKRDMIIQMGADRRDEFKGQARVMADQDLRARATSAAQH